MDHTKQFQYLGVNKLRRVDDKIEKDGDDGIITPSISSKSYLPGRMQGPVQKSENFPVDGHPGDV